MTATYRLQLTPDFDFDAAAAVVPYLADLGISHVYASPYLQATPGSTHGYDVVDHSRVNEELGGEKGRSWFCRALTERGMGHILDVVPNHMAIGGPENAWWWDVLENGPSSRFAGFFDVDWEYPPGESQNRILLPVLGDHYGRLIESGEVRLERVEGSFFFRYYEHIMPVSPRSLSGLLTRAARSVDSDELGFLASALDYLPLSSATDRTSVYRRHRDKEVIRTYLAELLDRRPNVRRAVDAEVERVNTEPDLLDALHEAQNYRLALWRLARSDLGYRRFFDINTLIGLRMEEEEVFYETHHRVLEWLQDGSLQGVRVDHPDGLRDPRQYFRRMRSGGPTAWIFGEKILEEGESLPPDWPIEGTTGYDFLNAVNRMLVPPEAEERFTEFYRYFTGEQRTYEEVLHASKHLVLKELFAGDVYRLVDLFLQICGRHRRYRDFIRDDIAAAISEVLVCFPVYRTYVVADTSRAGDQTVSDVDRSVVDRAIGEARKRLPDTDGELFEFLESVLTVESTGEAEGEFVMRFQQLSGPVMAKGAEDTAFYVYNRLCALNEVGGNPGHFGATVDEFHDFMAARARDRPNAMSAASTHDTKRSEDTRARMAALAAVPDRWEEFVHAASVHNEQYREEGTPDRNLEYLIYQNLIGAWPISFDRLWAYAEKAMREAKTHTTWTNQNSEYESRVRAFLEGALRDDQFCEMVENFVGEIALAGWRNSFAATLIRFTAPGVPDIYQGCELWSHTLVDPDNREPVDYEHRKELLLRLSGVAEGGGEAPGDTAEPARESAAAPATPREIYADWARGLPKLHLIRTALALRTERPHVFSSDGGYAPLEIPGSGDAGAPYLGYTRGEEVIVLARRFNAPQAPEEGAAGTAPPAPAPAETAGTAPPAPAPAETTGTAPPGGGPGRPGGGQLRPAVEVPAGTWENRLTGRIWKAGSHDVASLLEGLPGALLVRRKGR
ncbi:MAG: malto-oligosyltrehalose synthase [bacterium]